MIRLFRLALLAAALAALGSSARADSVIQQSRVLQNEAMAAYKAGDFAASAKDFAAALALRPHHPALLYNFAATSAKAGHADDAIRAINDYAAMGLFADVEHDADFDGLKDLADYKFALAVLKANLKPIGTSAIAAFAPGVPFLAEGVAFDGTATRFAEGVASDVTATRFFLSSVDQRKIVVLDKQGERDFVAPASNGLMGAFGLALDAARGRLWVASSGVAHTPGLTPAEIGSGGVFSFALSDGHLLSKAVLPKGAKDLVIGDVAVTADGSVFATDSLGPTIYTVTQDGSKLEPWLTDDNFGSLQGVTSTPDGSKLVVADYATGLNIIDRTTKKVEANEFDGSTTLIGIDGLYRAGNQLLAVQNGVQPNRILAITFEAGGRLRAKVISANDPGIPEPTLGTIMGDRFCVVANAQWSKFKQDGTRTAALAPPYVSCVRIPK